MKIILIYRCALCDNRSRTDQCASRLIIYISRISHAGVVAQSPTRHAIHGCVGDRCATPPRPMREQNNRGRPHDFGDCCTTSVNAIRRVHDGPTTAL